MNTSSNLICNSSKLLRLVAFFILILSCTCHTTRKLSNKVGKTSSSADSYTPNISQKMFFSRNQSQHSAALEKTLLEKRSLLMTLDEIKEVNRRINAVNVMNIVTTSFLLVMSILSPEDPSYITIITLLKMLEYTKFLNIYYTGSLGYFFLGYKPVTGVINSEGLKLSSQIKAKFLKKTPSTTFTNFGVAADFIVNFWSSLIALAITLVIFLIFCLIDWLTHKNNAQPTILLVCRRARITIQNYFIGLFYISFMDIMLFTVIQLQYTYFGSFINSFSFLLAIIFFLTVIGAISLHYYLIYKNQSHQDSLEAQEITEGIDTFKKNLAGFSILFYAFKDMLSIQQLFLPLFQIRSLIFALTIATLHDYPIPRIIIIDMITIFMLVYVIVVAPFTSAINTIQQIGFELCLLCVNTCLLILALLDNTKTNTAQYTDNLSEAIIIFTILASVCPILFILLKGIYHVIRYFKNLKQQHPPSSITIYPTNSADITNKRLVHSVRSANPNHLGDLTASSNIYTIPTGRTEIDLYTHPGQIKNLKQNTGWSMTQPKLHSNFSEKLDSERVPIAEDFLAPMFDLRHRHKLGDSATIIGDYWLNPGMGLESKQVMSNGERNYYYPDASQTNIESEMSINNMQSLPLEKTGSVSNTLQIILNKKRLHKRMEMNYRNGIKINSQSSPSDLKANTETMLGWDRMNLDADKPLPEWLNSNDKKTSLKSNLKYG